MTCVSGTATLDGPVDVLVISEEPGTGLGARIAGTRHDDPGVEVGEGPPTMRVRIDSQVDPAVAGLHVRGLAASGTGRSSPARPTAAGCGWCCAPPRPSCCCATTGSCATCPASARHWSSCRSEVPLPPGESERRRRRGVTSRPQDSKVDELAASWAARAMASSSVDVTITAGTCGAPGRSAVQQSGARLVRADRGARPRVQRAHRPPHPHAGQRRDADGRRSWCGRPWRPGWTCSG